MLRAAHIFSLGASCPIVQAPVFSMRTSPVGCNEILWCFHEADYTWKKQKNDIINHHHNHLDCLWKGVLPYFAHTVYQICYEEIALYAKNMHEERYIQEIVLRNSCILCRLKKMYRIVKNGEEEWENLAMQRGKGNIGATLGN